MDNALGGMGSSERRLIAGVLVIEKDEACGVRRNRKERLLLTGKPVFAYQSPHSDAEVFPQTFDIDATAIIGKGGD